MRIGLDFDNTLAGYDRVFSTAACSHGYIDDGAYSKLQVRKAVRALEDGENKWMALQGEVYGKRMAGAELLPGAGDFLNACRARGFEVVIVSHKTVFGHFDEDRVNLRDAARAWMAAQGFFDTQGFAIPETRVYFESTRQEKVARIAALGCNYFVDDLEEVFAEPGFPEATACILFDPDGRAPDNAAFDRYADWKSIELAILGH